MSINSNYLICKNCFMTPKIDFQLNKQKIYFNCSCGKKESSSSIDKFLEKIDLNSLKCSNCLRNYISFQFYFCSVCKTIKCNKCIKKCNKNNHNFGEIENINFKCFSHFNNKAKFYCFHCKENYCEKCLHKHKFHKNIDFSKIIITNNENKNLMENYKKLIKKYNEKMNRIKNKKDEIINKLNEMINNLKSEFDKFYRKNENICFYLNQIYNSSKNLKLEFNYQKYQNLIQINCFQIAINRIVTSSNIGSSIKNLINYMNHNDIILFSELPCQKLFVETTKLKEFYLNFMALENGNFLNYNKNNVVEYNSDLKIISSFEINNQIDKIIEIKKNILAIFSSNEKVYIYEKENKTQKFIQYEIYSLSYGRLKDSYKNYIMVSTNSNSLIYEIFKDKDPLIYKVNIDKGIFMNEDLIISFDESGLFFFYFKNNTKQILYRESFDNIKLKKINNTKILVYDWLRMYLINIQTKQNEIVLTHLGYDFDKLFIANEQDIIIMKFNYKIKIINSNTFEIKQKINKCNDFFYDGKNLIIDFGKRIFEYIGNNENS